MSAAMELLPCPFCGKNPELVPDDGYYIGCMVPACLVTCHTDSHASETGAVKAWNARANLAAQAGELRSWRNTAERCETESQAHKARAEQLEEALHDLVSWFPDKPSRPEWRIAAGEWGADDAIAAARALLPSEDDDNE